ncbi:hypothetical protein D3C81_949730 [compost metagenome]
MSNHTQIFGGHSEGVILFAEQRMLIHTQIKLLENPAVPGFFLGDPYFFRASVLEQIIFPAAGLTASTPIGIPVCKMIRQYTASRIGGAHCPMNECLNLNIHMVLNLCNFFKTGLPSKHNTG